MGNISSASITRYPTLGTVRNRILFGMNGGLFVSVADNGVVLTTR